VTIRAVGTVAGQAAGSDLWAILQMRSKPPCIGWCQQESYQPKGPTQHFDFVGHSTADEGGVVVVSLFNERCTTPAVDGCALILTQDFRLFVTTQ
jgi:hypothetical protein